jgi:hypothetical protein
MRYPSFILIRTLRVFLICLPLGCGGKGTSDGTANPASSILNPATSALRLAMYGTKWKRSSPRSGAEKMQRIADDGSYAAPYGLFDVADEEQHQQSLPCPENGPQPGRGTFFDEHIDLRDPEGARLTERLIEVYDQVCPRERKRGRNTLTLRIRRLAANVMRATFFRDPPAVLYLVKADAEQYAEKPSWMRHGAMGDIVNALERAGLVRRITGKKMPYGSPIPSWASSYWPTDEMLHMAAECGVTPTSIGKPIPDDELVQLFAPKPRPEWDRLKGELVQPRRGKRVWFEPTADTQEWAASLKAINNFYRQQEIGLRLSSGELDQWLAGYNADPDRRGAALRQPETFATDLHRVFNNGNEASPTFDEGGRLFGGWWMNAPEELRRAITINGQPTVELDYANCHPRMLYHQRGFGGDGELYRLPEIAAYEAQTGVAPDTYRPCVKWLTQILINGRGRPDSVEPPKGLKFPPDIPRKQIVDFIEEMHQPIADAFQTGAGLGLMRLESDIALEIVGSAMIEGWIVLPIHDSFITTFYQRDKLKEWMITSYIKRLAMQPIIKG